MITLLDLNDSFERDPDIAEWWSTKDPALSLLARQWWDIIKTCGPDVRESLHNGYPAACLDLYPFAYVDAFTSHVNVGFYLGAFLSDPHGLLIGSGKRMRHVKLWPGKPVEEAALTDLIRSAYTDMQQRLVALPPTKGTK